MCHHHINDDVMSLPCVITTLMMMSYLVVPHADVGPDVIVDYRLLLVFRLQNKNKNKCLAGI